MKKTLLTFLIVTTFLQTNGQSLVQKFFFDFGLVADSTKYDAIGNNGNYWNNYTGVGISFHSRPLVNTSNVISNYHLAITNITATNGFTGTNGPGFGPTTNTAALGELGIASATTSALYAASSVFTNGQLTLSGLDAGKGYKLSIFGSRAASTTRVTRYTLNGLAGYTFTDTLTTSGTAIGNGAGGVTYNNSRVVQSTLIKPTAGGTITLDIATVSGGFCYLNCMKMEEYDVSTEIVKAENNPEITIKNTQGKVSIEGANDRIELFSASGIKMLSKRALENDEIELSKLTKGVYVLLIDGKYRYKILN